MEKISVWWGRRISPRTVILILTINSFVQTAMIWWPEKFGGALDFLSGLAFGTALGFGIGALVTGWNDWSSVRSAGD